MFFGEEVVENSRKVPKEINHTTQNTQNKYKRFYLQLGNLKRISHEDFEHLNWLHVTYRFK